MKARFHAPPHYVRIYHGSPPHLRVYKSPYLTGYGNSASLLGRQMFLLFLIMLLFKDVRIIFVNRHRSPPFVFVVSLFLMHSRGSRR